MCIAYRRELKKKYFPGNKVSCQKCSSKFTSMWNLRRHIEKNVCTTAQKFKYADIPVICQECFKFCLHIREFQQHKATSGHVNYKYQCIKIVFYKVGCSLTLSGRYGRKTSRKKVFLEWFFESYSKWVRATTNFVVT